jgi:hypothetical protein
MSGREAGFHVLVDHSMVQPLKLPPIRWRPSGVNRRTRTVSEPGSTVRSRSVAVSMTATPPSAPVAAMKRPSGLSDADSVPDRPE